MKLSDFKTNKERLEECGWKNCGVSILGMEFQKVFGKTKVTIFLQDKDTEIYIGDVPNGETTSNDIISVGNELEKLNVENDSKYKDSIYELVVKVENFLRDVKNYDKFRWYSYYVFGMITEIKELCEQQNMYKGEYKKWNRK